MNEMDLLWEEKKLWRKKSFRGITLIVMKNYDMINFC